MRDDPQLLGITPVHSDLVLRLSMPEPSAYMQVRADEAELGRVISNLFNNATEAAQSADAPSVTLNVWRAKDVATIEIVDNGAVIPDSVLSRLGELDNTQGKKEGQGLGPYHAVQQVRLWAGAFAIARPASRGTRATVTL